jgi:hypothetical protein
MGVTFLWITFRKQNRPKGGVKNYFVDLRGIEPRLNPCHGSVIPLYYRPIYGFDITTNYRFCKLRNTALLR